MNGWIAAISERAGQMERSQWLPLEVILERQWQQLAILMGYMGAHCPYFSKRVHTTQNLSAEVATTEGFSKIPLLTRRLIQEAGNAIFSERIPASHGNLFIAQTSGSTGEPITIRKTGLNNLDWMASNLMEHLWHQRDFSKRQCFIRPTIKTHSTHNTWGPPISLFFETGPSLSIPISTGIEQVADSISHFNPDYVLIYPTVLAALTHYLIENQRHPFHVEQIRTIGETLSDETRRIASEFFDAEVKDCYSSTEFGTIAIECPVSDLYHVMADHLIVEVLRENGEPCEPFEIGQVVITDLNNFATPLIRYATGDYAALGGSCPCGRGLPTLKKIYGRERNLVMLPDGTRHWPLTGFRQFREIAPIQQYQLIQENLLNIEVRLVVARPLTAHEENALGKIIQNNLGFSFQLQFNYFEKQIPRSPSGKFEEFVCRL